MVGGGESKLESFVQAMWKQEQGGKRQLCQFWATHPLPIIRQVNRPPLCCLGPFEPFFMFLLFIKTPLYGKCKPGLWVCDPRCYGGGHFPGAKFLRKLSFNSSDVEQLCHRTSTILIVSRSQFVSQGNTKNDPEREIQKVVNSNLAVFLSDKQQMILNKQASPHSPF